MGKGAIHLEGLRKAKLGCLRAFYCVSMQGPGQVKVEGYYSATQLSIRRLSTLAHGRIWNFCCISHDYVVDLKVLRYATQSR